MASTFVADGGGKDHRRLHPLQVSPQNSFKKAHPQQPPTPTPTCTQGHHQPVPMCVCAPATHAGSFKCRLHRVNSHGQSAPTAPPPPAGPASSTRTVEAQ